MLLENKNVHNCLKNLRGKIITHEIDLQIHTNYSYKKSWDASGKAMYG
jgi:hypothetical protein